MCELRVDHHEVQRALRVAAMRLQLEARAPEIMVEYELPLDAVLRIIAVAAAAASGNPVELVERLAARVAGVGEGLDDLAAAVDVVDASSVTSAVAALGAVVHSSMVSSAP